MYRVEAVVFDKSDGGRPRPSSGAFYDVCANAVTPPDCLPTFYRIVRE